VSGAVRSVLLAWGSAAMLAAAEPLEAQCASPEHRQFDFVVGNWLVRDSAGRAAGTVTLAHDYGKCVLVERWRGINHAGEALGIIGYRAGSRTWHRDYLDQSGAVLSLDGRLDGATMVLTGRAYEPDGVRMHRVTWTPWSDGRIEQKWETSTDTGRSWQTRFARTLQRMAE
jgi:hypothetical protein